MAQQMRTPKDIALEFETTAKTLRKFLRKDEKAISANGGETPGKGGRWAIPASQVKSLQKRFDAWIEANRSKQEDEVEEEEAVIEDEVTETTEVLELEEVLENE
jgi:hypothetical protein